jgi:hypothetical protein
MKMSIRKLLLGNIVKFYEKLRLIKYIDRNLSTVYEDASIVSEIERREHFGQHDHCRMFGNDFGEFLENAGFFIEVIDGNQYGGVIGAVIGPADYDDNRMFICRKESFK